MNSLWPLLKSKEDYFRAAYPDADGEFALNAQMFGPRWVLDMSCGAIARNAYAIRKYFGGPVLGFDLPNVVQFMNKLAASHYDEVTDDLNVVCVYKPTTVVCIKSVQHYGKEDIHKYFSAMSLWPHLLYIETRCWCDDGQEMVHDLLAPFYKVPRQLFVAITEGVATNPEYHWSAILTPM
jgi:hypothetical protein